MKVEYQLKIEGDSDPFAARRWVGWEKQSSGSLAYALKRRDELLAQNSPKVDRVTVYLREISDWIEVGV